MSVEGNPPCMVYHEKFLSSVARSAEKIFGAGGSPGLQYFGARKCASCSPRRSSGLGSESKQYQKPLLVSHCLSKQYRNHCFESSTRNHCFDISPLALLWNQSLSTAFHGTARSCFDFYCFDWYQIRSDRFEPPQPPAPPPRVVWVLCTRF